MRRLVLAAVLGAATLLLPSGEPAVAQATTLPTPDFDNDGFGDLAVGVPGEDVGADGGAGAVVLLFGSAGGLGGGGGRLLTQDNPEPGDGFGTSLAVGELTDAGAVSLISTPASDPDEDFLWQGVAGVSGTRSRATPSAPPRPSAPRARTSARSPTPGW